MMNQTLIETGRFFRSGGSMQSRAQIRRALPVAEEQFQSALDDLSEQIFIAKAFLERDYEAIRAKKAALQRVEDVVMSEPEVAAEQETTLQPSEEPVADPSPDQVKSESVAEVLPPKPPKDANADQRDLPVKEEKKEEGAAAVASTQPLSAPGDFNFDSMLNDTAGANDFDLNLDFGDDDVGNDGFLSGSNLVNASASENISNEGANNQSSNPPPDFNTNAPTDLTGMDNNAASAPMGGDAFDLELQKAEAFSTQAGNAGEQSFDGQGGGNMEDVMAPGESRFDDLFMENDGFGGDGDGLVNLNDLDDSWFT
ncbi:hypothetical protein BO71DRAFT_394396 [Aspergillus ellipticus CBS 707.79]|uniref:Uncharacterized protein n=1 Tax=Aspergillus ellipticus CBS 707.79 TaxID=1448320 RepID=A0A319DYP6_9EURO|nr:hypothetical protein BO71DRAFT_394396 [Aspergillus ellipticus CBS 707.79]